METIIAVFSGIGGFVLLAFLVVLLLGGFLLWRSAKKLKETT